MEATERTADGIDGDGVDVSLIRWMLGLTPTARLAVLQGFVDSVVELRHAEDAPTEVP
jgi:hypothetical protein